jgi:hypothetical protein
MEHKWNGRFEDVQIGENGIPSSEDARQFRKLFSQNFMAFPATPRVRPRGSILPVQHHEQHPHQPRFTLVGGPLEAD